MDPCRVAVVGAGGMARNIAGALAALPAYYDDAPPVERVAVAAPTPDRRGDFARRFGFTAACSPGELWPRGDFDTLVLTGPNATHAPQLLLARGLPSVRRVYVEKPLCVSRPEEEEITRALPGWPAGQRVQAGFQFLQMGAVRRALAFSRGGGLGTPVHFTARYLHGSYLKQDYRDRRRSRLLPAPAGGALADLGCHALSLLVALVGDGLDVVAARASGRFDDVPAASDLCTTVLLHHPASGAAGTLTASRVSAGAGDLLEVEVRGTAGAVRVSTERPDVLECYDGRVWAVQPCGNDYGPASRFPAAYVAAGWLRSLTHALYLFLGGADPDALVPGLPHALAVQRLLRRSAEAAGLAPAEG